MADISKEIENLRSAVKGKEVRGSLIAVAEKVNSEVEENTVHVDAAVGIADEASQTAQQAAAAAQQAIKQANETLGVANAAKESAQESAAASSNSAAASAASEGAASVSAAAAQESAAEALRISEGFGGFDGTAESVPAIDVQGLVTAVGGNSNVQALINAIADQVENRLLAKANIVNNGLTTAEGYAADARQLNPGIENTLAWQVAKQNSDLAVKSLGITTSPTGTITSADFEKYQLLAIRISSGGWSRTELFPNRNYICGFFGLNNTAGEMIRMDYDGSTVRLSGYTGTSFNDCEVYGLLPK